MSGVDDKRPERDGSSPGVVRIFGQMLLLPFSVFVYSMELLMRTMRGVQQTVDQGMEILVGESVPPNFSASESDLESEPASTTIGGVIAEAADPVHKEIDKMRDKDLSDDQLKLVRYKILFVKRDYEVAFPEREDLVHDNISGEAFTAWKIAEFIQRLPKETIPDKWRKKKYPKRHDDERVPADGFIHRLDEDDKKYLRVYYEVLERYVREEDDTEVDVLKDIHKAIERLPRINASSSTASATTTAAAPSGGGGGGASVADTGGSAGGGRGFGD